MGGKEDPENVCFSSTTSPERVLTDLITLGAQEHVPHPKRVITPEDEHYEALSANGEAGTQPG